MVVVLFRSLVMQLFMIQASTNMHNKMTDKVLRAKVVFFDSNPSGRIISRFAKDIGIIDNLMPIFIVMVTMGSFRTISVVISIAIVNPYLLIPTALGTVYMIWVCKTGLKSMLESQRLDFLQQGPINQTYSMVVNGLVTFRAYRQFGFYQKNFLEYLELSANATFCYNTMNRWIALRLDAICALIATVTAAFCLVFKGVINSDLLIFSLQITLDMVVFFSAAIRFATELHNFMISSQKVYQYTELDSEDDLKK